MARNFEELEHDSLDEPAPPPETLAYPKVEKKPQEPDEVYPDNEIPQKLTREEMEKAREEMAQRRREERGEDWLSPENPHIWEGEDDD